LTFKFVICEQINHVDMLPSVFSATFYTWSANFITKTK